jgi:epoxyqueuosine reductase
MQTSISEALRARALDEGFSAIRIASADALPRASEGLQEFIAHQYQGDMEWLATTIERRVAPRTMWPEARTAVMFAMNYGQGLDALKRLEARQTGVISAYALNRDYHDVVKSKLKKIAGWFATENRAAVKVFIDTAPLMEKPLAQSAGLGWQGKHTNLVSRELGSWFFIGTMLTNSVLPYDAPEIDHCGSCHACLDICPTKAFPAPYKLDARRCISYLTIEHKGHIAREFRGAMGNRIFGCDDCLAVCPWNKFAQEASEAKLKAREDLISPSLEYLAALDDAAFRKLFSASPVKRIGRDRFIRNVLIAIGNSGDGELVTSAIRLLNDASPLVRAMAVWALLQLLNKEAFELIRGKNEKHETDLAVKAEWGAS